jgi:RNA polymerase sigma-70 factor (ECF subfamily)
VTVALSADDLDELYRRHAQNMLTFFARRTWDPDAAVDLVAETFAAAVQSRRRFRGRTDDEAAGWLYGIARHQLSGWHRRGDVERRAQRRLGVERRALTEDEYDRIVELAGLQEARRIVADELAHLGADSRSAVQLRVVQERSYADVARELGISEQTARARVSRALRTLGRRLDQEAAT